MNRSLKKSQNTLAIFWIRSFHLPLSYFKWGVIRVCRTAEFEENLSQNTELDPFTVDRTGDSNGVFETMRREIFHFKIFLLSLHFARFLCINILEQEENLTGPTFF